MAFILAWPLLLDLKVTHRPKGQSVVPRWEKSMFIWLGNNGPFGGGLVFWSGKPGFHSQSL